MVELSLSSSGENKSGWMYGCMDVWMYFNAMILTDELRQMLTEEGYVHLREFPGRGVCGVKGFLFTWGLCYGLDGFGYRGRWCYDNELRAAVALVAWSGEGDPMVGWLKYKGDGGERVPVNRGVGDD